MALIKTFTLNIVILAASFFAVALLLNVDAVLGFGDFRFLLLSAGGWVMVAAGFALRFWASSVFYENGIAVLKYSPQEKLVTTGPYAKTRNPLYLGILLMFAGAAVVLGSYAGIFAAILLF